MHALEENYLRTIMLLDSITGKVTRQFKHLNISSEQFVTDHPAYIDLNMSFYHLAIFQARKLYEAEIRYGLTNNEWYKLKSLREEVTHAKRAESKEINRIADINAELIPILNKLSLAIHTKYKLEANRDYQTFVKSYFKDLDSL